MNTSTTTPEFLIGDRVLLHSRRVPAGGPIRTRRPGYGTRHVPAATPFGGHHLRGAVGEDTGATR